MLNLDVGTIESLWQALTMLQAREQLLKMTLADWPHMKPERRKRLHRSLYEQAYPDIFDTQKSFIDVKTIMELQRSRAKQGG